MGGSQSISPEDLSDLLEMTHFKKHDLKRWYKKFMKDYPQGRVDVQQFNQLYGKLYKTNFSNHLAEHIFNSLDDDKNGYISFKELMSSLSVTSHGTLRGKLEWLFRVYDLDQDGEITLEEVNHMVECMQPVSNRRPPVLSSHRGCGAASNQEVRDMFQTVDLDSNGSWSMDEFVAGMVANPKFIRLLKVVPDTTRKRRRRSYSLRVNRVRDRP